MWAIRAARAFTGRDKILKIRGGYNGTYDDALAIEPNPRFPNGFRGLPKNTLENVLFTHWNDKELTEKVLGKTRMIWLPYLQRDYRPGAPSLPKMAT